MSAKLMKTNGKDASCEKRSLIKIARKNEENIAPRPDFATFDNFSSPPAGEAVFIFINPKTDVYQRV